MKQPSRIESGIFGKVPPELFHHILKFLSSEALMSCRGIENPKRLLFLIKENYKIYIEDKEGKWVNMSNNQITQ